MMMIVERDEVIITPHSSPNPRNRLSRFLTPSLSSPSDAAAFDLPLSASHLFPHPVEFSGGWINPLKNWTQWVDRMRPLYESTWRQAGIHDAILVSTYSILPDKNLILALVERWCPLTNTFVFPFGEATIALDDVAALGGYSVVGSTVRIEGCCSRWEVTKNKKREEIRQAGKRATPDDVAALEDEECCGDQEVLKELEKARVEMNKSSSKKPTVNLWMRKFMGSGGRAEHAAFLVLWLSRHVFPFANGVVGKHLHALALRLAEGTRLALAPAVLASLYRDLTLLKQSLATKQEGVRIWSPLVLVQVWGWERFPRLGPRPNEDNGGPRMRRWEKVAGKGAEVAEVRAEIECGSVSFVWRPYVEDERCWQLHKAYPEKEKWVVSVCPGMREEFKLFANIVRVSELVGIDCIQPYFPHRVSMQFGFDQDIPGRVARFNETPEIAWEHYDRPIRDEKLYIPSRSFRSGVTGRYLDWWNESKLVQKNKKNKKNNAAKGKDRKKRKMTDLLRETRVPTSPRTKRKKMIVQEQRRERSDGDQGPLCILSLGVEEPPKVCGNRITTRVENVVEVADEARVGIAGRSEDSVNKNKTRAETRVSKMRSLRAMPLEARIWRLEILVARLKEERMSKLKKKQIFT